jgi:hypothetical protein
VPQPSAFTWCGAFDLSDRPTHIQELYELLPALWGTEIDFTEIGSEDELKLYATAVVLGSAMYELEHAGNQGDPLKVYDLLPILEQQFGLTPGAKDTVQMRQAALAAAELLPVGCIGSNVVNSVKTIVGAANFKAIVPSPEAPTPTVFPTSPGTGPGQFRDVRVQPRFVQLVDPVASAGTFWCAYQNLDLSIATPTLLLTNDKIVVGAGNTAQMEPVTVLATSTQVQPLCTPGYSYFQAAFLNTHDVGAPIVTGSFPYWWSTQRLTYIVLSAVAATNRPLRAKIDALLTKIMRTVDIWAIVQATTTTSSGGTVGPLLVGGAMGTQPIGSITFLNSM